MRARRPHFLFGKNALEVRHNIVDGDSIAHLATGEQFQHLDTPRDHAARQSAGVSMSLHTTARAKQTSAWHAVRLASLAGPAATCAPGRDVLAAGGGTTAPGVDDCGAISVLEGAGWYYTDRKGSPRELEMSMDHTNGMPGQLVEVRDWNHLPGHNVLLVHEGAQGTRHADVLAFPVFKATHDFAGTKTRQKTSTAVAARAEADRPTPRSARRCTPCRRPLCS